MNQLGRSEDDPGSVARPETLRVVLADDHPLYREALVRAVEWHPQLELVGEAGDGPAALALIEQLEPDVAILDLHMPRMSGLQICSHLDQLEDPPATEVLLVSAFASTELIAEANRCGAAGYVSKDSGRRSSRTPSSPSARAAGCSATGRRPAGRASGAEARPPPSECA